MGEIADMMLEGVLCEGCGEYLGDGDGFPGLCAECAVDRRKAGRKIRDTGLGYFQDCSKAEVVRRTVEANNKPIVCKHCGKRFKTPGANGMHVAAVHKPRENAP